MNGNSTNQTKTWLAVSGGLLLLALAVVAFLWKEIPPEIPWFFSLPWGEDQLMKKSGLIWVLGTAIIIATGTSFLPRWTKSGDKVIEQTIMMTIFLGCLLLTISLGKVLIILTL